MADKKASSRDSKKTNLTKRYSGQEIVERLDRPHHEGTHHIDEEDVNVSELAERENYNDKEDREQLNLYLKRKIGSLELEYGGNEVDSLPWKKNRVS